MSHQAAATKPKRPTTGGSHWIDPEHWTDSAGILTSVVMLDQKIAFDVAYEEDAYTVTLIPAPAGAPWWKGAWRSRTDQETGPVQAKLYTAQNGEVVLIGRWSEHGREYPWFVELH